MEHEEGQGQAAATRWLDLLLGSVGATLLVIGFGLWLVQAIARVGESVSGSDVMGRIAGLDQNIRSGFIVTGFILLGLWGYILTRRRGDREEPPVEEGDDDGELSEGPLERKTV